MNYSLIIYESGPLGKEVKEVKNLENSTRAEAEEIAAREAKESSGLVSCELIELRKRNKAPKSFFFVD